MRPLPMFSLLCLALAAPALAQAPAEAAVTANGMATIKRAPETMRMQVEIRAEGKDLKDALANLKAKKETLKAELVKLKAAEATVDLGTPTAADAAGGDQRRAMMERMMRARMAGKKAATTEAAAAKPVVVTSTVRADFPLAGADAEALLLAATDLQNQIKAAKLFENKAASAAKSEEEEEAAAEEMNSGRYGGDEGPKPGEPSYLYVARITEAEHAKATAEAFEKAKAEAARLAKAAGSTLGALKSISSHASMTGDESEMYSYRSSPYAYQAMRRAMAMGAAGGTQAEAFSPTPTAVTQVVMVNASFSIK